ncbi:MAG: LCCL domain-containing protein [Pseudomonadota bacterium]
MALPSMQASAGGLGGLLGEMKEFTKGRLEAALQDGGSAGSGGANAAGTDVAVVPSRGGPLQHPAPNAHHLDWDTKFTSTGLADRKLIGHVFPFYCPPAPARLTPRHLTGSDRYAFHIVVCRAGVHAGRITLDGGNLKVRMEDGNVRLTGSTRNGITTHDGPSGIRTVVFVD